MRCVTSQLATKLYNFTSKKQWSLCFYKWVTLAMHYGDNSEKSDKQMTFNRTGDLKKMVLKFYDSSCTHGRIQRGIMCLKDGKTNPRVLKLYSAPSMSHRDMLFAKTVHPGTTSHLDMYYLHTYWIHHSAVSYHISFVSVTTEFVSGSWYPCQKLLCCNARLDVYYPSHIILHFRKEYCSSNFDNTKVSQGFTACFCAAINTLTCVGQVDNGKENQPRGQRDSQKEQRLELLSGQPVFQILQKGIGLKQRKHTWKHTHTINPCPQIQSTWTAVEKDHLHLFKVSLLKFKEFS